MLLDGRQIAQEILDYVKTEIAKLPFKPVFCDVLVGEDPASAQYVKMKGKTAEKVGISFRSANFPSSISTEELIAEIKKISIEPNMKGLIVQLPLPAGLEKDKILNAIDPKIDVDSTGQVNTDLFYQGKPYVVFPTAAAVMELLKRTEQDLSTKKFLILGRGQLVGKPIEFLIKQYGYAYDVAHSKTENTDELLKNADVIISAVGKPKLIIGSKIKPGAIVIDAGTSESDGGIVGDVDVESVSNIASFFSPVPGGVGPITVAKLLENVLKVAKQNL